MTESKIITLNVGGHLFNTTEETLTKGNSYFSRLLKTEYGNCKDPNGHIFIDRDGTHFRTILNYLRTGKFVLPNDPEIQEELLIEADFYDLKEVSSMINKKLNSLHEKHQYCKVLCNGDWIGQLNYLVERKWEISKFMMETESKYRELDDYGKPLKNGIGWYDIQTQCILLKRSVPLDKKNEKE